jgi:soluble lytic murein transglycosylase
MIRVTPRTRPFERSGRGGGARIRPVSSAHRAHRRRWRSETVVVEARRYHFDPGLVLAVIHVESRFDTYAVSPKDALGLMQLLPSTGKALAPIVGVEWHGPQTLFDPVANVRLGVAYLRQLTDRYNGSVRTALVAYNWGPGRIDQFMRAGDPLPREYSTLVLEAYDRS